MNRRIVHYREDAAPRSLVPLLKYSGGVVAEADSREALALLARSTDASLLYFSKLSFTHALRKLNEADREGAIRKRLATWAPTAVNQGFDWLYRSERRNLTLAAVESNASAFRQTMTALEKLANEGAYGNVTLPEILVFLLQKEALLAFELSQERLTPEASERHAFSLGLAAELKRLGRPEFSQHLPFAEAVRSALVTPRDAELMSELRSLRLPAVEWREGVVSVFGPPDLEAAGQQGKRQIRILYPDARRFRQDLEDLTRPQLEREFEDNLRAGTMPGWWEYLNSLRLETALLRRAAREKATAAKDTSAAVLTEQISIENTLLAAELAKHPTWLTGELGSRPASLAQAEQETLEDALFLEQLSGTGLPDAVHRRYKEFAAWKSAQH